MLENVCGILKHLPERQLLKLPVEDCSHLTAEAVVHVQGLVLRLVSLPPSLQLVVILQTNLLGLGVKCRILSHDDNHGDFLISIQNSKKIAKRFEFHKKCHDSSI